MKEAGRPYDGFEERIEILAALNVVNILVRREVGQHKYDLIKAVRPHVLVMSKTTSSVSDEDIQAFEEYCGEVNHLEATVPPDAVSITAKVRRIRKSGKEELARDVQNRVDVFTQDILTLFDSHLEVGGKNGIS